MPPHCTPAAWAAWRLQRGTGALHAAATACAVGAVFAGADYGVQIVRWRKRLRMSHEEIKRDQKENDGDPLARSRRRALHRQIARGSLRRVKDAGVRHHQSHAHRHGAGIPPSRRSGSSRARARGRRCRRPRARTGKSVWYSARGERGGSRARLYALACAGRIHSTRKRTLPPRKSSPCFGHSTATNRVPTYTFAGLPPCIVAILIVPLPPFLLDVLLGVNVFASALALLLSVTIEEPLQFSAFALRCSSPRCSGSRWTCRRRGLF